MPGIDNDRERPPDHRPGSLRQTLKHFTGETAGTITPRRRLSGSLSEIFSPIHNHGVTADNLRSRPA